MLNVRVFKENEFKDFEKFINIHPPVGANGIKMSPNYILLTYENGELRSKEQDISHLTGELNTLLENQLEEVRQLKDAIKTLEKIDFYTRKHEWKDFYKGITPMHKMCEMTRIKIEVIIDLLKDLGKEVQVSLFVVPELPEEPILAEMESKKKK